MYHEPFRLTLARTGGIAIVVGLAIAVTLGRSLLLWPMASLIALWPSLGGHYIELWFLNWLRPRLPMSPAIQIAARIALWFIAGILFLIAMQLTAAALTPNRPTHWPGWWLAGLGFVAIELIAHLALHLRARPNFYDAHG